ncbi:sugar ABC transporter substrate-binding protein, partial [Microbacterium sp. SUBG005]
AAALALAVTLVATGCSGGAGGGSGSGGDGGNLSITFLPKNLGNPYFETSNKGGEEAIGEFGGTFEQVGPSEATPTSQVQYIQTAAQQGVGARHLANDPSAICDARMRHGSAGAQGR